MYLEKLNEKELSYEFNHKKYLYVIDGNDENEIKKILLSKIIIKKK